MDTTKAVTHLGLCAGYGGIELGLHRAVRGMRSVAFCEIEAFAVANLVSKMEAGLMDPAPIWPDLRTFPWGAFRDRVDILTGGFPCQPFSAAGKRDGDEDPRHLFPFILSGIQTARPTLVFLENVDGIVSAKLAGSKWRDPAGTPVLLHVLRELERVGYRATAGVFSAAECGAPHQRKRVFILAHKLGTGLEGLLHDAATQGWQDAGRPAAGRGEHRGDAWPSRPGEQQYGWEPPRVVGDADCRRQPPSVFAGRRSEKVGRGQGDVEQAESGQTQPSLGGDADGSSGGMDYAELCVSGDNRTDELRLLGNGVVPATAERAFRVLIKRLLTP
jgi:DNA (cytosine-5)-methyltransferase 1